MYILSNEKNIYHFSNGKQERFYDINTGALKSKNNRTVYKVPIKELRYSERKDFTAEENLTYSIFWMIKSGYSLEAIRAFERIAKRIISYFPEETIIFYPYIYIPSECFLFIDKNFPKKQDINFNALGGSSVDFTTLYKISLSNYYLKKFHISKEMIEVFQSQDETELLDRLSEIELKRIDKWVTTDKVTRIVQSYNFIEVITKAKEMGLEIPKINNFTRWAYEVNRNYKIFVDKKNTEKIRNNYANTKSIWNFENDNYIVKIPESVEDIVKEGNSMNNCVGTYVNSIANNDRYVCFIRKKTDPEKSYITCEVTKDGKIKQFLKRNNQNVSTDEEFEFWKKFEEHIKKQILNGVSL